MSETVARYILTSCITQRKQRPGSLAHLFWSRGGKGGARLDALCGTVPRKVAPDDRLEFLKKLPPRLQGTLPRKQYIAAPERWSHWFERAGLRTKEVCVRCARIESSGEST